MQLSDSIPFLQAIFSFLSFYKIALACLVALRALCLGGLHNLVSAPSKFSCLLTPKSQLADFHFVVIIPSSRKPAISFIDYYSSYPTNCISGSMIENWHKTRIPSFIMITNMDWQFDLFSINFNIIRCEFLHIYCHCKRIIEAKIPLFA